MKSKTKIKIIIFMTLGILIALSPLLDSDFNLNYGDPNLNPTDDSKVSLNTSKTSGKIQIIGNSGWITAKTAGVCTGSGTLNDPYVIEDLEINGGDSGSCILIANSDVHFKIENCTVSNAGEGWGDGGIKMYNVYNGNLTDNIARLNDFIGIILEYCHNNTISGNTANFNIEYGIGLWYSDHNVISGNTFKFNGWGLSFETSNNNTIMLNDGNENTNDGIGIWNSVNNIISENNLIDNDHGLSLYHSDGNNILRNKINGNYFGIDITQSSCNVILNNTFSMNNFDFSGTQDVCDTPPPSNPPPIDPPFFNPPYVDPPPYVPPPYVPFPFEIIVILGITIASAIFLIIFYKRSRKSPRHIPISVDKTRYEFKVKETLIDIDGIEPEFKSKLIIPPETKKIDIVQEEVIQISPEKKPRELKLLEEEVVSVQEEIIEKEEKIVKDTIEVPTIEINSCQFCGMELSSDVLFCLRCGHKLKK